MTTPCVAIEEIADVVQLPRDDARRRHVESCARCSALAVAIEAFVSAQAIEGSNPASANDRLAAFITTLAERDGPAPASRTISRSPRRGSGFSLLRPVWGISAAVAVLLVLAIVRVHPWLPNPGVVRGGSAGGVIVEAAGVAGDGTITLRWEPVAGADSYAVTILAADMSEIASTAPTPETTVTLPPDSPVLPAPRPGPVFWQVTAFASGDAVATSAPQPLDLH
jgi:hypothetical protein